jgi:hypothetical protein
LAHPGQIFGAYPIITGFACYVKRKNCRKAKKKRGLLPARLPKLDQVMNQDISQSNPERKNSAKVNSSESKNCSRLAHFSFLFK